MKTENSWRHTPKRPCKLTLHLTRRVTIGCHERARESMGETPIPLSNTPCHSLLKQRARERGIAVGTSLTRRDFKLPQKIGPSKNSQPIRERTRHERTSCGAKGDCKFAACELIIVAFRQMNCGLLQCIHEQNCQRAHSSRTTASS